jgi:sugar lactone lactonase YvrE
MRTSSRILGAAIAAGLGAIGLTGVEGCSSNNSGGSPPADAAADAPTEAAAHDAAADGGSDADATTASDGDAASPDADASAAPDGDAAAPDADAGPVATYVVRFDGGADLPEGLWLTDAGTPLMGLAPLGEIVSVAPDGGAARFAFVGDAGASNSFTLGITQDSTGNVYVGVGVGTTPDAGNVPAPGVYRVPSDGGTATLFSSAGQMKFANGLDFMGTTLFVADSDGFIYAVDPSGTATIWSSDPLLAPDPTACDGGVPLAIGANGIGHDSTNVYVTNTNHGRVVKIPIVADGGAGTAAAIVDSCSFVGADGLTMDPSNGTILIAVNAMNELVRVTTDGGTSVLASGAPLHSPASLVIDTSTGKRRLLFTNATFFGGTGDPGLLTIPLQ